MINNEIIALLKMAVAEETCGLQNGTDTTLQVTPNGLQIAPPTKDVAAADTNNNNPNWWMWLAIAATIYAISKK